MMKIEEVRPMVRSALESTLLQWNFVLVEGQSSGFELTHQTDSLSCRIVFGCSLGIWGLMFTTKGIRIRLNAVEDRIYPLELKYSLSRGQLPMTSSGSTFIYYDDQVKTWEWKSKLRDAEVVSLKDKGPFCTILNEYLLTYAFPIFRNCSTIAGANAYMGKLTFQDIIGVFSGSFPAQLFRAMVIADMAGNDSLKVALSDECLRIIEYYRPSGKFNEQQMKAIEDSHKEVCQMLNIS